MIFYVYMLKSINSKIQRSYVGYTNNLISRIRKHNTGLEQNQQEDINGKSSIRKNFMIEVQQCLMNMN